MQYNSEKNYKYLITKHKEPYFSTIELRDKYINLFKGYNIRNSGRDYLSKIWK